MPLPYAEHVVPQDPVVLLSSSLDGYRQWRTGLADADWDRPIAPGKWTMRQVMVHVAQWELIWGVRLRCAVGVADYVMQPIEQDDLMGEADAVSGPIAFEAFEAVRVMHIAWTRALTSAQRERRVRHAIIGEVRVEDGIVTMTGHAIHHLKQLREAPSVQRGR